MKILRVVLSILSICIASPSASQNFVTAWDYHLKVSMEPEGVVDKVFQCSNSEACIAAIAAAAAYLGVPPSEVIKGKMAVDSYLKETYNRKGENHFISIYPKSSERVFCRVYANIIATVPNGGSRRPSISFNVWRDQIEMNPVTPKQQIGDGRSIVEVKLVISEVPRNRWGDLGCTAPVEEGNKLRWFFRAGHVDPTHRFD